LVDALAEPLEAVRRDRLRQAGTDDQDVVVPGRDAVEPRLPDLPELPLDPVPLDGAPDRPRNREPEPGRGGLRLREPVEDEKTRRHGAAVAVHGVEVARAGQAVRATLRAAPLQDQAAGASGHPGAEAVLALPAANVRLVGALHLRKGVDPT